jgi:ABC-type sulfate transport system substrate-binding protein
MICFDQAEWRSLMIRRILPLVAGLLWASSAFAADYTLLNVSYDPTRELYADFNKAFVAAYQKGNRQERRAQAVAWRLGLAGARGDRRPAGRCRHAGAGL